MPERASDEPQLRRPAPRLRRGVLTSLISAVALLVVMFALAWYGVDELPGPNSARTGLSHTENAWHGLTVLRWLMLITIAAVLGSIVLHARQRGHGTKTSTGPAIAALGTVTGAALVYRVLIELPSPNSVVDQKLGAFLGLLCAIGIALGGYESMREERARARRVIQGSRGKREARTR
jgi:hypothetical protein